MHIHTHINTLYTHAYVKLRHKIIICNLMLVLKCGLRRNRAARNSTQNFVRYIAWNILCMIRIDVHKCMCSYRTYPCTSALRISPPPVHLSSRCLRSRFSSCRRSTKPVASIDCVNPDPAFDTHVVVVVIVDNIGGVPMLSTYASNSGSGSNICGPARGRAGPRGPAISSMTGGWCYLN